MLITLLVTPFTMLSAADGPSKPKIIFILADDLGIGNVSCYGADNYKTPNIHKLASTGMRFSGNGVYLKNDISKGTTCQVNGQDKKLGDKYMPDLMHEHLVGFMKQHLLDPFFVYHSMSHVHGEIVATPDSAKDSKDLFGDNVAYMDKLVGKLVAELESLKLRENTLIIFIGDNGTAKGQAKSSTVRRRDLSGQKGTMFECGGLVPLIVSWPSKAPAGKVCSDLGDSTDFIPTFAELTGSKLPTKTVFDGHSIAPQLRGEVGQSREWIYNQLASMWYVREAG